MTQDKLRDIARSDLTSSTVSLDGRLRGKPGGGGGSAAGAGGTLESLLADSHLLSPDEACEAVEGDERAQAQISQLLSAALTEREVQILRMRYGLLEGEQRGEARPPRVIAAQLGMDTARVSVILKQAMMKLRRRARHWTHDDVPSWS